MAVPALALSHPQRIMDNETKVYDTIESAFV
jgi:hypothetical protein